MRWPKLCFSSALHLFHILTLPAPHSPTDYCRLGQYTPPLITSPAFHNIRSTVPHLLIISIQTQSGPECSRAYSMIGGVWGLFRDTPKLS
ncbi:hypothetical protein ASPTUDRAFT_525932 [Aspergillus tubingensis CBS 134.48]|uniref:Secreted protein n=1 Tax=Aspergillus tubingensis (strain CBS 134.48) TaxID=767770 RepID=A0A1L9NDH5_ASPTC|nr:hypothetical protein ASPTUDRAFT_525932 [Aspergillus tubingensis CBS 134.48]